MSQNDFLHNDLYPAIYSEYRSLLDGIYSTRGLHTDTQKQLYLQNLQDTARKLWCEYQRQDISPNYSRHDYQEVYLMRYLFPHSLIVPTLLHHLKNLCHFKEELVASFFGCGPGSEIYGFMRYLNKVQSDTIKISLAMLDSTSTAWVQYLRSYWDPPEFTGWKHSRKIVFNHLLSKTQSPTLYAIADFNSDIEGEKTAFLYPASEVWVKRSDLICIQFCLNEIPVLRHKQLRTNLMHLVEIMKPGALMLVIERDGYDPVRNLLTNFHADLSKFKNVQPQYLNNSLDLKGLNNYVPEELSTHLFLTGLSKERWQGNNPGRSADGLRLSNSIKFHWLAVSKQ